MESIGGAVTEADRLRLGSRSTPSAPTTTASTPTTSTGSYGTTPPTRRASTGSIARSRSVNGSPASLLRAFRALKEGKWSAESAEKLSNDEFFDLLGIPELTNADAAHSAGLPGPLIEKRDGCHVWKPEDFPPGDPRHGWTWEDCLERRGGPPRQRKKLSRTTSQVACPLRRSRIAVVRLRPDCPE